MNTFDKKSQRVASELLSAGISGITAMHPEARKLVEHIHDDEHIMAAIRGRCKGSGAMFIATNKRMLFMNYLPLFQTNDDISYDVLAGVSYNSQGIFAGVIIHTRMGDFTFRFVNKATARRFVDYLERKHLELNTGQDTRQVVVPTHSDATVLSAEARLFLVSHNIGVLSSHNPDGGVNGAAVYYTFAPDNSLYIVTRQETSKAKNVKGNHEVAFTIYDEPQRTTIQIRGIANFVDSPTEAKDIIQRVVKPHVYNKKIAWPPITQIIAGPYQVINIIPTEIKYRSFNN